MLPDKILQGYSGPENFFFLLSTFSYKFVSNRINLNVQSQFEKYKIVLLLRGHVPFGHHTVCRSAQYVLTHQ